MSFHRVWGGGAVWLSTVGLLAACGGTVFVEGDDTPAQTVGTGGSAGQGGGEGGQGGSLEVGALAAANAPDQFSVRVSFNGAAPEVALAPQNYTIASPYGALLVTDVLVNDATSVTLVTEKQKLGVNYALTLSGNGDPTKNFLAADSARFWTLDLSSPNFEEVEIVCDRVGVGQHLVVYLQQGETAQNVAQTIDYFDNTIYPLETSMFQASPDQDGNDRVVMFALDGKGAYGGYFNPLDTLSDEEAQQFGYHSNETEILYLNVEDGFIDVEHVVTHEFMHMLYHEHPAHDSLFDDWSWHNEGMAECGVRAVTGDNEYAPFFYTQDPFGDIAGGLSMIEWEGGNYSQYALSYLFLSYVAGQLGGVPGYAALFDLHGSPESFDAVLQPLGTTFGEAHMNSFVAAQVQAPSGLYSHNGLVSFPAQPKVANAPLSLLPFSGAFVQPATSMVSYPGTQGQDILYVAINGAGVVDTVAPFDATAGRLLVFNTSQEVDNLTPQPSGNIFPAMYQMPPGSTTQVAQAAVKPSAAVRAMAQHYVRMHPPPFNPLRLDMMKAWQRRAGLRIIGL